MARNTVKNRERDVQKSCVAWLRACGVFVIRVNSGAMAGEHGGKRWFMRFNDRPGCSDLLCVLPADGRFLAVEVKRKGGKPTDEQKAFLQEVSRRGGLALVVDSLDALREALRVEGYEF